MALNLELSDLRFRLAYDGLITLMESSLCIKAMWQFLGRLLYMDHISQETTTPSTSITAIRATPPPHDGTVALLEAVSFLLIIGLPLRSDRSILVHHFANADKDTLFVAEP